MESDLLDKLKEFPSPFFWSLHESMYENVHEKLTTWERSEADRLACNNTMAFLSYARGNDSLAARQLFQQALNEDAENLVALTSLAYLDVKHSKLTEAEEKRQTILQLTGSGNAPEEDVQRRWAAAMFEKAFCLTRFGPWRYREAQACIDEALKFDSDNKEWLKTETFLLIKQVEKSALFRAPHGQIRPFLDRAATNVLKLQQMEPGNGEIVCMRAELFWAAGGTKDGNVWIKGYKRKNPDQVLDPSALYIKAYELCPTNQHVCRKAVLHFRATREWQKLEEIVTKALKVFPNDHFLCHQYGLLYLIPYQLARSEAKAAKGKAAEDAEARAKLEKTAKSLPRAEQYFRKGVTIDPLFTRCRICLAQCLYYQGQVDQSWDEFRIATERARHKKNIVEARREWAKLLIEEGNESGALMQLREALQFEGQFKPSVYDSIDFALGGLCKLDEHDLRPIRVRAEFALEAGKEDKAIEYFTEALKIDGDNVSCLLGIGKAYRKKGKEHFEEAKKWFEEASRLGSDKADDELLDLELEMMKIEEENAATGHSQETVDGGISADRRGFTE